MSANTPPLHVVGAGPLQRLRRPPRSAAPGDLGLLAFIVAVCLVPIVGLASGGVGWGQGAAGLGTAGALLAARALVRGLARR